MVIGINSVVVFEHMVCASSECRGEDGVDIMYSEGMWFGEKGLVNPSIHHSSTACTESACLLMCVPSKACRIVRVVERPRVASCPPPNNLGTLPMLEHVLRLENSVVLLSHVFV
eukprot:3465453-Amphidinium_carterae.1